MNDKKKKIIVSIVLALVGGLFGFLIAFFSTKFIDQYPTGVSITLLILVLPLYFIAIALHELGHAIAGVYVGFDFRMYVVGPFMWEKTNGQWIFKWNTNVNTSGGMVLCMPNQTDALQKRFAWFAAGGPLASLTTMLFFLVAFLSFADNEPSLVAQVFHGIFFVLTALSAFLFLITAIPFHMGGFSSDGARFIRLMRGGDHAMFEVSLLKTIAISGSGGTPDQFNKQELLDAIALGEKIKAPMAFYLYYYLFYRAWSMQEIEEAEYFLNKYLSHADEVPEGIRNGVWLEGVLFYSLVKPDGERALSYWKQYEPSALISKILVLGAEASILRVEEKHKEAQLKFKEAIASEQQAIDKGIGKFLAGVFKQETESTIYK